jgi:hypothetical protein
MVLGDMIGVEAKPVVKLRELQSLLVLLRQQRSVAIEMIENSELHATSRMLAIAAASVG